MRRAPAALWLIGVLALFGLGLGGWLVRESRWQGPLYCIERAGQLWGGEAGARPPGFAPACPTSASYRREVRSGAGRVEQYRAPGWQPRALLRRFTSHGFVLLSGEFVNPNLYEAFVERQGARLYYLAERQGNTTAVIISGS